MNKVALIPAYKPDEKIFNLISELKENDFDVVVVNDGSGEEYREIFDEAEFYVDLIEYEENKGKGYALKQGLKYIEKNYGRCIVVTMDCDGQHLVSDAVKLAKRIESNRKLFMIGKRVLPHDAPIRSRIGNSITRLVYRTISGLNVYDTQSGLRAFCSDYISWLVDIEGDRYEYEMNVLLEIAKEGIEVEEQTITTIYFDKKNSISHFNTVKDSARIYGRILKFACSSFICFLIDYFIYALMITVLGTVSSAIVIANLTARAFSSIINFSINKRIVFKTKGKHLTELIKYFSLVLGIILINTIMLKALVLAGINAFVGKIAVEFVMFFFSYIIQNCLIFGRIKNRNLMLIREWRRNEK